MADARPNPFDFDVTKIFADFRYRPFDVEAVWAAQRRNIEALSQANQAAVEGVNALARRQMEMTRETFEGFSALMRDLAQPASAEDRIAKNTDYVKQMLEKGVTHSREIATTPDTRLAGTSAQGVVRAIGELSDGAVAAVPLCAPWSEASVEALADFEESPHFGNDERAVIRYAVEATSNVRVSDATWNALKSFLDTRRIMELVQNVAFYNMVVRVLVPLGVELEEGVTRR